MPVPRVTSLWALPWGGTNLNPILADNLVVDHNGSGLLLFNRPFQAAAFGITKNGSGTMQTNNNNLLTGALNINAGTLIANSFSTTGSDLANFTAINLGGATLRIGASTGTSKTYATGPITVSAASTLEYRNTTANTYTAAFTGTGFALNADLAVKNTSTDTTLVNGLNLSRPITGTGDMAITTYNNLTSSADNFSLGRVLLSGDNSLWSGDLTVARGTVSIGGNAVNSAGTGVITIGTTSDAFGAGVTFFPAGPNGSTITYTNAVTVTGGIGGGFRAIKGGNTNHSVTFSGLVTLNGDLTLDHTWSTADRRISLTGGVSGAGGLTVTRAGGNAGTTAVLSGTGKTYIGNTTVASGASLSVSTSLTSDIVVQGGRIGGAGGSTTQDLTMAAGSTFFFFISPTFRAFDVSGTVTLDNTFGVDDLVGGSQGEAITWANVPNGVYTLIGTTASTFNTGGLTNNIENFGPGNAAPVGTGSQTAYFQNGGGTGGGGLQLVVTGGVSGFDAWKTANSAGAQTLADDHDDDGVDNGTEYFIAGNASSTGFTAQPGVVNTAGVLSVTWPKAANTAGYPGVYNVHFFVETSDTLAGGSWVTAPLGTGAGQVSITGTGGTSVKYTFPAGTKRFARLKVTGP